MDSSNQKQSDAVMQDLSLKAHSRVTLPLTFLLTFCMVVGSWWIRSMEFKTMDLEEKVEILEKSLVIVDKEISSDVATLEKKITEELFSVRTQQAIMISTLESIQSSIKRLEEAE